MKSYKQKNYEQALIETYLKLDELLRLEKVNQFLKDNSNIKENSKLSVRFSYGFENMVDGMDFANEEKIKEVIKENDKHNPEVSSNSSKNKNSENSSNHTQGLVPKENIIDLTKNENNTPKTSSPRSKDGESKTTISRDILTYENQKIQISLRSNSPDRTKDKYDDLVAKEMGTTANILLIKNNYLYLANVGDSLAVLFKNGVAIRLNQEHKTALQSECTRIYKSGLKIINNRIEGRLNLTRAIGIKIILKMLFQFR